MEIEFITKADFHLLKNDIVDEIRKVLQTSPSEQKEWLKTSDVLSMLSCSPGTLQNLRVNGSLPFSKMGGTIYYLRADVLKMLSANKKNAA
jgi:Helix-turn-helix domain